MKTLHMGCLMALGVAMLSACCSQPADMKVSTDDGTLWSVKMADSELAHGILSCTIDPEKGYNKWDYTAGVILKGLLDLYDAYGDAKYFEYVEDYANQMVEEDGTIKTYDMEEYNIDRINTGKIFFRLYEQTKKEKYRLAATALRRQLDGHPRNEDGGYWHKARYPHQMWLDGIYMGGPFYAEYAFRNNQVNDYQDIINWFRTMDQHCYNPAMDLYCHACDVSRQQSWCDPETGLSKHCWGRALGWFAMAAVDVLDFLPKHEDGYDEVVAIFNKLASHLRRMQQPDSGLWYQVIDRGGDIDNYLEATCACMFTYALAKGVRQGVLDESYLDVCRKAFEGITTRLISHDPDGWININDCSGGAGLGGDPLKPDTYRAADYDYYIYKVKRVTNSSHATGPFIMAALELERVDGLSTR